MKSLKLIITHIVFSIFIGLPVFAQGTAFTYQGRLDSGGVLANGSYDLTFTLYNSNSSPGTIIAGPVTNTATVVSNGLFMTTIDFGNGVFTGSNYWLEIGVQTNGGNGFTALSPRQPVLPVPLATFANTASNVLGKISSSQLPSAAVTNSQSGVSLTGAFTGSGSGLTNVTHNGYALLYSDSPTVTVTAGSVVPLSYVGTTNGWSYNEALFELTNLNTGIYLIQFEGHTSNTNYTMGLEVNGLTLSRDYSISGVSPDFSHSFLALLHAGDALQFGNFTTNALIFRELSPVTGVAFSATIVRVN